MPAAYFCQSGVGGGLVVREGVARCCGNLVALPTIRPRKQIVINRSQRKVEGCLLLVTGRTRSFQYSGNHVCRCQAAYDNGVMFF